MSTALIQMAQKAFCLSQKSVYKKLEQSAVTTRNKTYITPQNGEGPWVQNQKIVFQFPSNSFMDPQTLRFEFLPAFTGGSGSGTAYGFANTSVDWIRRLVVKSGSTEIVDIDNYNVWCAFQYKTVIPWTYSVTSGVTLDMFNLTPYARTTEFGGASYYNISASSPTVYVNNIAGLYASHTIMNGLFQVLQYIPLSLINNLQIEIYTDLNINAIMVDGSQTITNNEAYSISNCRLYYDQITFDPAFADAIANTIKTDGELFIPFYQIRNHEKTLPLGVSNVTFQISERVSSLNQIYVIPIPAMNSSLAYNTIGCFNPQAFWIEHQFRLNSIYFPTYPINTYTERAVNNLLATNQYGDIDSGGLLNPLNFSTGTFNYSNTDQWLCEFYAFDFEREKCPSLMSGYNTDKGNTEIEFIYKCTGNAAVSPWTTNSDKRFLFFTLFDATIGIKSDGSVVCYR